MTQYSVLYKHNVFQIDNAVCRAYEQVVKSTELYKIIGRLIRNRRDRLEITQEKLAHKLNMSRASLANIEVGRQNLSVHQLYLLSGALKLTPSDLLPPVAPVSKSDMDALPIPADLNSRQKEQIARLLEDGQ